MKYFKVSYDGESQLAVWHLAAPCNSVGAEIDANLIPAVGPAINLDISVVRADERHPGAEIDFNFGAFGYLVVRSAVANLIELRGGQIQRFPCVVMPGNILGFEVVIALDSPKGVVDVSNSAHDYFSIDDTRVDMPYGGVAPRQKGMLSKAYPLKIDSSKALGHEFFRPWEYMVALIVSENLKTDFEKNKITGVRYTLVS